MARRPTVVALVAVALVAVGAVLLGGLLGRRGDREPAREAPAPSAPSRTAVPTAALPAPPAVTRAPAAHGAGFRSEARLREHHDKHGREFGAVGRQEYLALARALRDRPLGPRVIEAVRADGVVTRFDRDSGAFIAFDPDGTIRTFFKPRDGEAYFRRQRDRAVR